MAKSVSSGKYSMFFASEYLVSWPCPLLSYNTTWFYRIAGRLDKRWCPAPPGVSMCVEERPNKLTELNICGIEAKFVGAALYILLNPN